MTKSNYRKLVVWQRTMDLAVAVYSVTKNFPPSERFNLTGQMRRSATSIPSNIAEGEGRDSKKDARRFLAIALGSLRELETQIILAGRVGVGERQALLALLPMCEEAGLLIAGFRRSKLKSSTLPNSPTSKLPNHHNV